MKIRVSVQALLVALTTSLLWLSADVRAEQPWVWIAPPMNRTLKAQFETLEIWTGYQLLDPQPVDLAKMNRVSSGIPADARTAFHSLWSRLNQESVPSGRIRIYGEALLDADAALYLWVRSDSVQGGEVSYSDKVACEAGLTENLLSFLDMERGVKDQPAYAKALWRALVNLPAIEQSRCVVAAELPRSPPSPVPNAKE